MNGGILGQFVRSILDGRGILVFSVFFRISEILKHYGKFQNPHQIFGHYETLWYMVDPDILYTC